MYGTLQKSLSSIHSFCSCIQNTTTRCGTKPTLVFTPLYFDNSLHVHTMKVFKQIYHYYLCKCEGITETLYHMYRSTFFSLDDKIHCERSLRVSIFVQTTEVNNMILLPVLFVQNVLWKVCLFWEQDRNLILQKIPQGNVNFSYILSLVGTLRL